MAFPDGWGRRATVTIDNTQVAGSGDLTNLVMLCTVDNLPSEMFDSDGSFPALAGGGDIRFSSDEAGSTQLSIDVVVFTINANPALGTAQIHVKVPTTDHDDDTVVYVWYNKTGETQPAVTTVPGGRDDTWTLYEAVFHCEETSGNLTDSTGNGNTATAGGSPLYSQTGKMDNAVGMDSGGDEFEIADSADTEFGSALTATIQVNTPDWNPLGNSNPRLISKADGSSGWSLIWLSSGTDRLAMTINSDTAGAAINGEPAINTDLYIAGRYDGTDAFLRINDGSDSSATRSGGITGNTNVTAIGNAPGSTGNRNYFDGTIDEVRLAPTVFTNDFLTTDYNTQNDSGAFATAGTPETPSAVAAHPVNPLGHPIRGAFGGPIG